MEKFSSWSNRPSNRRVAKRIECELNEEVGPNKAYLFCRGSPNHTHGTRVVVAL